MVPFLISFFRGSPHAAHPHTLSFVPNKKRHLSISR
jgi:hypothetical protein